MARHTVQEYMSVAPVVVSSDRTLAEAHRLGLFTTVDALRALAAVIRRRRTRAGDRAPREV